MLRFFSPQLSTFADRCLTRPVWQNSAPANDGFREPREASPRRDDGGERRERSPAPRRDRSRSPAARNGGGDGGNRGR